jgi:hypothetical protein
VRLVNYYESQVGNEIRPQRVIGQDADREHVGIGQNDVAAFSELGAGLTLGISVVRVKDDRARGLQHACQFFERAQLVLRERLGRKEIERARARFVQDGFEDGDVVTERLAGGCAGCDDDVFAGARGVDRVRLVRKEFLDVIRPEAVREGGLERGVQAREFRRARREMLQVNDLVGVMLVRAQARQKNGENNKPPPRFEMWRPLSRGLSLRDARPRGERQISLSRS